MVQISNCDSLDYWTPFGGTISLDTADKIEGIASIELTGDGVTNWIIASYNPPGIFNWTDKTWLQIDLKPESLSNPRIYLTDLNGSVARWYLDFIDGWVENTIDLNSPSNATGVFDKSIVDKIEVYYSTGGAPLSINIDNINVGPDLPSQSYLLTINSNPMGIPVIIRGVNQ